MLRYKSTQLYLLIVFIYLFFAKGLSNVTPQCGGNGYPNTWDWFVEVMELATARGFLCWCSDTVLHFTFCSVTLTFKTKIIRNNKKKGNRKATYFPLYG